MIGFTLEHLGDDGQNSCHSKTIARDFCLQIINEVYDIDYNRYWHADLDSLLLPDEKNWFSSRNEGAFYLLRALGDNKPVAAGGLYNLRFKPSTRERLLPKYRADMNICQIVRVYLSAPYRGNGLGRQLWLSFWKPMQWNWGIKAAICTLMLKRKTHCASGNPSATKSSDASLTHQACASIRALISIRQSFVVTGCEGKSPKTPTRRGSQVSKQPIFSRLPVKDVPMIGSGLIRIAF